METASFNYGTVILIEKEKFIREIEVSDILNTNLIRHRCDF